MPLLSPGVEMSGSAAPELAWRDGKRYAWSLGLVVPVLPLLGWALVELTGLGLFWWFGLIFLFLLLPLVDTVIGEDSSNPPQSVLGHLQDDRYYRWCTYLFLPWAITVVLFAVSTVVFGPEVLPYLAIQAVVGASLLEVVNYLEHYGLQRECTGRTSDGRNQYERVDPSHSWNSNRIGSNVLLYHLQRHSDHHARASRRYQALRHFDESPQLPSGYATMIAIAILPPIWRRVMDRRVDEHYEGDLSRANVLPGKQFRISG